MKPSRKAGTSEEDAAHMAHLLVLTDLRGVFSHGTRQTPGYIDMILEGKVNPRPTVRCVDDSPTTAIYDGDGGMGHFASYHAAKAAVKKAKEMGLGAATSRNHFHFGSAGKYTRLALAEDCVGFAVSCHRFRHSPDGAIATATGASPMSFAIPAGDQPPIVADMATGIDAKLPLEQAFEQSPAAFFKMLGLSHVSHALGGFMAGIWLFDKPPDPRRSGKVRTKALSLQRLTFLASDRLTSSKQRLTNISVMRDRCNRPPDMIDQICPAA